MTETCPVCASPVAPGEAACPACGFKLAGSTQSFKPLDWDAAQAPTAAPAAASAAHAALRVVRGPQTGMLFELAGEPLTIGRSPRCDVFLNDMTVSREHAVVSPTDGGYEVADCNSYNGVWVNNENVQRRRLQAGDVVQLGVFLLVYEQE